MHIKLPHDFTPRPYQHASNRAFFIDKKRFSIEILHRRAGKSKNALNFLVMAAMQKVGNYYHTFPELKQARGAIWNNIDKEGKRYIDHIPKALLKRPPNNSEMRAELINGSMIQLAGADRYDSLMGGNPAGIVLDEYSLQNPMAWHYLSPIITENGGWAKFIYTPRGMNHGWELYKRNLDNPAWFVQKLDITQTSNWDGTPIMTEEMVEERRREGMPEELIQQEFYCSFEVSLANAFYSREIDAMTKDGRLMDFPYFKGVPVHTAWDIGRRDPTSIWFFQYVNNRIYLINYYQSTFQGMPHYLDVVKKFMRENNLINGVNLAPHDIGVTDWVNGRSRIDEAAKQGFYFERIPKLDSRMDGINCVRSLFKHITMHKTNCEMGLNCLKQYVKGENEEPVHNFASHPADALRTLAEGWFNDYSSQAIREPFVGQIWRP